MSSDADRINRRIAEWMGYRDIAPMIDGGKLWGYAPGGPSVPLPDYMTSADAVIPVVERLCRERKLNYLADFRHGLATHTFQFVSDPVQYPTRPGEPLEIDFAPCISCATAPTFASAAALAVYEVLEALEKEKDRGVCEGN